MLWVFVFSFSLVSALLENIVLFMTNFEFISVRYGWVEVRLLRAGASAQGLRGVTGS